MAEFLTLADGRRIPLSPRPPRGTREASLPDTWQRAEDGCDRWYRAAGLLPAEPTPRTARKAPPMPSELVRGRGAR